ncbi:GPI transamidase component PIG-T-like protein [Drosera capensis]
MAYRSSSITLFCFFIYLIFSASIFASTSESETIKENDDDDEEEFHEELLLRPLPDRKLLAHFRFESRLGGVEDGGRNWHLRLFPKSIYQLVHKFHIREMDLSFTQGRWNYERWGGFDPISSKNAKPPGVELWTIFDAPESEVDALWKNLTHTLSGLFCASVNFLESSTSYSSPELVFQAFPGSLRYGALPREAVCTENLTPWLKLLPCRDKAGLSELMDRPSIYRGFYHSQRLHLTSSEFNSMEPYSGIRLEQTLSIVLQPESQRLTSSTNDDVRMQPSWSVSQLFGRKVRGSCALSKSSSVFLQLDRGLVTELEKLWNEGSKPDGALETIYDSVFKLSTTPDKVISEAGGLNKLNSSVLYLFRIGKLADAEPFDLTLSWKHPIIWSSSRAPLLANRFLIGSGNERGSIAISLTRIQDIEAYLGSVSDQSCKFRVNVFQFVPWYIKVYYHTLKIYVDGHTLPISIIVEKMNVSPSEDKISPGVLEMVLAFQCDLKSAVITVEFDKGFLHINEYPPDANQGFDIPSAIISFPEFISNFQFDYEDLSKSSPMLSALKEKSPALAYTEVLLVPLTTPDFSMPYNVITITCTVFALYFGSLLNVLRRRVGEEERLFKARANKKQGMLPLMFSKLSSKLRGKPAQPVKPLSSGSKMAFKVMWSASKLCQTDTRIDNYYGL